MSFLRFSEGVLDWRPLMSGLAYYQILNVDISQRFECSPSLLRLATCEMKYGARDLLNIGLWGYMRTGLPVT
jgi:hypothetical protein